MFENHVGNMLSQQYISQQHVWCLYLQIERHLYNPAQYLQWSFFAKIANSQKLKFSIGLTEYASGL